MAEQEESPAARIARQLLEEIQSREPESAVFTSKVYRGEPIIRLGRDLRREAESKRAAAPAASAPAAPAVSPAKPPAAPPAAPRAVPAPVPPSRAPAVPEPIVRMRRMAQDYAARRFDECRRDNWGWSSYSRSYFRRSAEVFRMEAEAMADYEDDCPYAGSIFGSYVDGYEVLSDAELRGYFTWRTRWRAGLAEGLEPAEAAARAREGMGEDAVVHFAYLRATEIVGGCGVADVQAGQKELACIAQAFRSRGVFRTWANDYVIYHGLDLGLLTLSRSDVIRAAGVLRDAEEGLLGTETPGVWQELEGRPDAEQLLDALCAASRYRLERSALMRRDRADLAAVCSAVFARMVDHCRRRRKLGFVEGLFGAGTYVPYYMFDTCRLRPEGTHPDAVVRVSSYEEFDCKGGRWHRRTACRREQTSVPLGDLLQTIDRLLRERVGGIPPLRPRTIPKFELAFVEDAIEGLFARRAAEEAARVTIDRSKLSGIRLAAAHTRESLLVDEERDEAPEPSEPPLPAEVAPAAPPQEAEPAPEAPPAMGETPADDPPLTDRQRTMLAQILEGTFDEAAWEAAGVLPELEVDAINEALFDQVGDAVIEYGDAGPQVSEFYSDDVREMLR